MADEAAVLRAPRPRVLAPAAALPGLVLAVAAPAAIVLAWRSRGWPLIHDAPLMHYAARRLEEGAVPYRDLFDMNFPGTYLLHRLVLALLGPGDAAWRAFDVGWLALTCAALALCCRRFGRRAAAIGALLFALYHLAGGAWNAGQRDYLLVLFLLVGAHAVARYMESGRGFLPLALAGLALGCGMTLKPHAGLFWLVLAGAAALAASRAGRAWWGPPATVLGAGALPLAAAGAWLAWLGGLGPLVEIVTGYLLPLYSRLARVPLVEALGGHAYAREVMALLVALAVFSLWHARAHGPLGARRVLLLLGLGYGVLHYAVQGKGWEYHLYPLAGFACALAASWVDGVEGRRGVRLALAASLLLIVSVLGIKGAVTHEPAWIEAKERRVAALVEDLAPRAAPGARVLVLDTTEGGIHALFRLRLIQATRFLYDFHFFHDTDAPAIRALRAGLLDALRREPPPLVVLFERGWPRGGYERLREFPDLAAWIERAYRLDVERDGYRLYARRHDS